MLKMIFFISLCSWTLVCAQNTNKHNHLLSMPSLIYWAWEAPQNLNSIDPKTSGIAVLVASIFIDSSGPHYYLRQQPLKAPDATYRIAVFHITARPGHHPLLNQLTALTIAKEISTIFQKKSYQSLQIDFEAGKSQREFYQQLLVALRENLGEKTIISITALGSWCTHERWIQQAKLPINLVVPMYFSISHNAWQRQEFITHFPGKITQLAPECQAAIGLATFEKWQIPLRAQVPVFVFTKGRWQEQTIKQARELAFSIQH